MPEVSAGLAETLRALRAELNAVMADKPVEGILFELGETEVELQISVAKEAGVDGGVRLGVVSFGAKGGLTDQSAHSVRVTMMPVVVKADPSDPGKVTREAALIGQRVHQEPR